MTSSPDNPARARRWTRRAIALGIGACIGALAAQLGVAITMHVAPEALGASAATATAFARAAPVIVVLASGVSVFLYRMQVEEQTPDDVRQAPVYRGKRRGSSKMLAREDLLSTLENELRDATEDCPVSFVLVRIEQPNEKASDTADELQRETTRALLEIVAPDQVAGYLGAGAYAIVLPRTEPAGGYTVWETVRSELANVARRFDATLEETFVTSVEGETVQSMYGRCVYSLREVEFDGSAPMAAS